MQSLVDRESEFVAGDEVRYIEAISSSEAFVADVGAARERDLLHAFAHEEHRDPDHVHHVEVHEAGRAEAKPAVLVEDAHGSAEDLSHYHFNYTSLLIY